MDIYFLMDEVIFRDAGVLLRSKDAAEIVAPYLADVIFGVATLKEAAGNVEHATGMVKARDAAVAVKVTTDAHVVNAANLNHMFEVAHESEERGMLAVGGKESGIHRALYHTILLGDGAELIVGEVAGVVTDGAAAGMSHSHGLRAEIENVVEGAFSGVAQVNEHAETIHFLHHLTTEVRETAVLRGGFVGCGVSAVAAGAGL